MKLNKTSIIVRLNALLIGSILCLPASTLSDMAAKADAVVVGTVTTRSEGGTSVTFEIAVHRVLKGSAVPALVPVAHQWSGGMFGQRTIQATVSGIWLLAKTPSGGWDVLQCRGNRLFGSLFYPASVAAPAGSYAYVSNAPLGDALTFEAAAGMRLPGGSPQDLLGAIDPGAASTPTVLGGFVASNDTSFQAVGLAGMLMTNQPGSLGTLSRLWPLLNNEPNRFLVVWALRDNWRDTTPAGVGQLSALVEAPSTPADLRAAAIASLIATHTAASMPMFGGLLFGSNSDEQMEASIAISAFVNGCNPQTPATVPSLSHLNCGGATPYKNSETIAHTVFGVGSPADQAVPVAFWQAWWRSHPTIQQ